MYGYCLVWLWLATPMGDNADGMANLGAFRRGPSPLAWLGPGYLQSGQGLGACRGLPVEGSGGFGIWSGGRKSVKGAMFFSGPARGIPDHGVWSL